MSPDKALQFLQSLNPPQKLLHHSKVVAQTAHQILDCLKYDIINPEIVMTGAILHDVGKIIYPEELHQPGDKHEIGGKELLLKHHFPSEIADICVTHSKWQQAESIEALIVALADKLWKNKRIPELEDKIIRAVSADFWSAYSGIMDAFDEIGGQAHLL